MSKDFGGQNINVFEIKNNVHIWKSEFQNLVMLSVSYVMESQFERSKREFAAKTLIHSTDNKRRRF